jgi:hypothetical protein
VQGVGDVCRSRIRGLGRNHRQRPHAISHERGKADINRLFVRAVVTNAISTAAVLMLGGAFPKLKTDDGSPGMAHTSIRSACPAPGTADRKWDRQREQAVSTDGGSYREQACAARMRHICDETVGARGQSGPSSMRSSITHLEHLWHRPIDDESRR